MDHEFLVDYTLYWDVSRSPGDYWSSACFSLNNLQIKPYIIYESCHEEYKEVARFYEGILAAYKAPVADGVFRRADFRFGSDDGN